MVNSDIKVNEVCVCINRVDKSTNILYLSWSTNTTVKKNTLVLIQPLYASKNVLKMKSSSLEVSIFVQS